jgi:hypothetical protein
MKRKSIFITVFLFAYNLSQGQVCIDTAEICHVGCICYYLWDPVCGCDGNMYSNSCFALLNGVKLTESLSEVSVSGPAEIYESETTVLSASGGTYYSWNTGETKDAITVSPDTTTTYTVDIHSNYGCVTRKSITVKVNKKYKTNCNKFVKYDSGFNDGDAHYVAYGVNHDSLHNFPGCIDTSIICHTGCVCPLCLDPVCGCDGNTYPNSCVASLHGVTLTESLNDISVSGSAAICESETAVLTVSGGIFHLWNTGQSEDSITVSPDTTTTYTVAIHSNYGCVTSKNITLKVNKKYEITRDTSIQYGGGIIIGEKFYTKPGIYYDSLHTLSDCDSVIITHLELTDPNDCIDYSKACQTNCYCLQYWNPVCGCDGKRYTNPACAETYGVKFYEPYEEVGITGPAEICYTDTVTLTATGKGLYRWNTGDTSKSIMISPDTSTLYQVVTTSKYGCMTTADLMVQVSNKYKMKIDTSIMDGDTLVVNNNKYFLPGIYYDTLFTCKGCDSIIVTDLSVIDSIPLLNLSKINENNNFVLYPNPAGRLINVKSEQMIYSVELYSLSGQMIVNRKVNKRETELDVNHLMRGVYILKLNAGNQIKFSMVILK